MKKLMIAVCAVALAAAAQAGTVKWANYGVAAVGCDDMSEGWSGKIYLMDNATMSASDFVTAYIAGGANQDTFTSLVSGALNYAQLTTVAMADGPDKWFEATLGAPVGSGSVTSYGEVNFGDYEKGTTMTLFQVAYDEASKALFVSENVTIPESGPGYIPGTGAGMAEFYNDAANAGKVWQTSGGYQGDGWYTAVPEPTSGLLLLLGVAGLALRRRRA